mgnify:FL=1
MAKKQKKSKKNDGKKAAEAKNLAEAASKSAVVDDMEPLEATAANDAAALEAETATEAAATPVNPVDLEDASPLGDTYHRGPVILRGQMIPSDNTTANLLKPDQDTDWLHMDHGVCCASNRNSWTVSGRSPSSDLRSLFSAPHAPSAPNRSTRQHGAWVAR